MLHNSLESCAEPERMLLDFFESAYEVRATLGPVGLGCPGTQATAKLSREMGDMTADRGYRRWGMIFLDHVELSYRLDIQKDIMR